MDKWIFIGAASNMHINTRISNQHGNTPTHKLFEEQIMKDCKSESCKEKFKVQISVSN